MTRRVRDLAPPRSTLAVIPARGGSKRVPRKNIRDFAGRPLLAWPISAAQESGVFDRIVVSTDDDEIAEVALAHGAEVPFRRPDDLADDLTPTVPVVAHAIETLAAAGEQYDLVCCLYPAAVFVTGKDISAAMRVLVSSADLSYVSTVVRYAHPIQRALRMSSGGRFEPIDPAAIGARSQDLEERWHDAGQLYWGHARSWIGGKAILLNSGGFELPTWRVQDIDTYDDWRRAELLHALLEQGSA